MIDNIETKEKFKLSKEIKNIISNINNNNIAENLIKIDGKKLDIKFNNIKSCKDINLIEATNIKSGCNIEMRVGRFINKLFSDINLPIDPSDLEKFINIYKSLLNFNKELYKFEIVYGEDIRKYYLRDNYEEIKGILGESCMSYIETQKYLDIYVNNPDKIKMLIFKSESGKVIGRAIIWEDINMRIDDEISKVTLMDRIYTYDYSYIEQFKLYAEKNGWVYKKKQNSMSSGPFMYKGETLNMPKFFWYLENKTDIYPYLDTMIYYSISNGYICNKKFNNSVELLSTDGGYYND